MLEIYNHAMQYPGDCNTQIIVPLLASGVVVVVVVVVVVGQASVLQAVLWVSLPEHESPPPNGTGLVQVRVLYFNPPPQVTVQEV